MSTTLPHKKSRILKRLIKWAFMVGMLVALVVIAYIYIQLKPYWERAEGYDLSLINNIELPSIIYDKNGEELGRIFVENRSPVKLKDVNQKFIQSLIAGEDQRFYEHDGIDYIGLLRVAYLYIKDKEVTQGGSTLTQQLAKNAYRLPEEAKERGENQFQRKLVELFLARRITKQFTKDQVLEFYLNRIIFGSGYYGIRSASLGYFGKEPSELNWQESASLVGTIKNPSAFGPTRKRHISAREQVFKRLRDESIIDQDLYQELKDSPHTLNRKPLKRQTSHLYVQILKELESKITNQEFTQGGFHIYTSIDKELQDLAQKTLQQHLLSIEQTANYRHPLYQNHSSDQIPKYLQGSILIKNDQTGEIITYIGGRDFNHSQYDFIESGKRPLGTAFIPFIYAAYLKDGGHLNERVIDEPLDNRFIGIHDGKGILGAWGQEQAQSLYQGNISLYHSLIQSKINPTVTLGIEHGVSNILKQSSGWGFDFSNLSAEEQNLPKWLSGQYPTSLTQALNRYQALLTPQNPIKNESIINQIHNSQHQVIYKKERLNTAEPSHISHPLHLVSTQLKQALYDQVFHPHGYLKEWQELWNPYKNQDLSVKTSTTANFSDAWTIGSLAPYSCGIWVGFFNGNQTIYPNAFGKDLSGPIWNTLMQHMAKNYSINPRSIDYDNRTTICSRTSLPTSNVSFQNQICRACQQQGFESPNYAFYAPKASSQNSQSSARASLKECQGDIIDRNNQALSFYRLDFINEQLVNDTKQSKTATSYLPYAIQVPLLKGKDPYLAQTNIPNLNILRNPQSQNQTKTQSDTQASDILIESPFSQEAVFQDDIESIKLKTQDLRPF